MSKVNPAQFVRQVRQEVAKVSWPSRKETGIGTLMVFIMVFLAAIFFFVVDLGLSWGVQLIRLRRLKWPNDGTLFMSTRVSRKK